jgi:hypothetical protein
METADEKILMKNFGSNIHAAIDAGSKFRKKMLESPITTEFLNDIFSSLSI